MSENTVDTRAWAMKRRGGLTVRIPFDVLDAAIYQCLPGYSVTWGSWTRQGLTQNAVCYSLIDLDGLEMAFIIVYRLAEYKTKLMVVEGLAEKRMKLGRVLQGMVARLDHADIGWERVTQKMVRRGLDTIGNSS